MTSVLLLLALAPSFLPNLTARGMDVTWDASTKKATGYIMNGPNGAVGPFMVYFDAEEDHVSPQDRPQVRILVEGLVQSQVKAITADFAPLSTSANAHLRRVRRITLRVDPKKQISEFSESDNALTTQLPGAVQARRIVGTGMMPQIQLEMGLLSHNMIQTLVLSETLKLVGMEFTFLRNGVLTPSKLKVQILKDETVVAESDLLMSSFSLAPGGTVPPPFGPTLSPGFIDFHHAPVTLEKNTVYKLKLTNDTNQVIHIGVLTKSLEGPLFQDGYPEGDPVGVTFEDLDVALKLFVAN